MFDRIVLSLENACSDIQPRKDHDLITWNLSKDVLKKSEEKNWNLLDNPSRIRIQTIDSFCQTLVNEMPILSQFGGSVSPTDNADLLYSKAVDNLFSEINSASLIGSHIKRVLIHFDNDFNKLKHLFVEMIKCRDQWLPYAVNINNEEITDLNIKFTLNKWFDEKLNEAKNIFSNYEDDLISILNFIAPYLNKYNNESKEIVTSLSDLKKLPGTDVSFFPLWSVIFSLFFTSDSKLRKSKRSFTKKQGFPPKDIALNDEERLEFENKKNIMVSILDSIKCNEDSVDILSQIAKVINFDFNNQDWNILTSICKCLVHLYAELRLVFSNDGLCDFLEINNSALVALSGSNSLDSIPKDDYVRYKWDSGIKHILVDEFQDTSVAQYSLIEKLTEEWSSYNKSNEDKKTLFIVGDPMQSIYSFRAAKVGLFLQAKKYGIGDIKLKFLELKANFRSNNSIVKWNNDIFEKIFPSKVDLSKGAVTFSKSYGKNDVIDNYTQADITIFNSEGGRTKESIKIINLIKECQSIDPSKSIGILVRAKSHLDEIIPALEKENIPWKGSDLYPLSERESVMDCISLAKVFINPSDKLSWLSLIHSPFCGINLKDIQYLSDAKYCSESSNPNDFSKNYEPDFYPLIDFLLTGSNAIIEHHAIKKISIDGLIRLRSFAKVIKENWSKRGKKSLRCLIEDTWFELQGLLIANYSYTGDDRLAVQEFFNLLENLDQKEINGLVSLDLPLLEAELQSLFSDGINININDKNSVPPIEIMTIHKSKGLEFDTVIIPGLDKVVSNNTRPLLHWNEYLFKDGSRGFMMSPIESPTNFVINDLILEEEYSEELLHKLDSFEELKPSILYKILSNEKKEAIMIENIRLIYVASTRAKSRLHLLGCLDYDNELFKEPKSNSLLSSLWPSISNKISVENLEVNIEPQDKVFPLFKRPKKKFFSLNLKQDDPINEFKPESYKSLSIDIDDNTKRILGICAHEIYEFIINNKESFESNDIKLNYERWNYRLISLGIPKGQLKKHKPFLDLVINKAKSSEILKWILSPTHKSIHTEWDLTSYSQVSGKFIRSVIDCSFIDKNNCRWIIDFKFTQPRNETFVKFKDDQIQEYKDQLNNYYSLVRNFDKEFNKSVRETKLYLYFPLLDEKVEIVKEV